MGEGRDVPRGLRRDIEVEAGHRCAIPTCRATAGLEVHHIDDWAIVRKHEFANLILLCSNCHSRATKREIDKPAMRAYKANLSLTTQRYGDLERRVLDFFVRNPVADRVQLDSSHDLLLTYLVDDGLLTKIGVADGAMGVGEMLPSGDPQLIIGPVWWGLTSAGRRLVARMRTGGLIE